VYLYVNRCREKPAQMGLSRSDVNSECRSGAFSWAVCRDSHIDHYRNRNLSLRSASDLLPHLRVALGAVLLHTSNQCSLPSHFPALKEMQHGQDLCCSTDQAARKKVWSLPRRNLCRGLVIGHERELGYFSIAELEEVRGPMDLKIERDLYFEPKPVSQCT
jgi:hypothetical protein